MGTLSDVKFETKTKSQARGRVFLGVQQCKTVRLGKPGTLGEDFLIWSFVT